MTWKETRKPLLRSALRWTVLTILALTAAVLWVLREKEAEEKPPVPSPVPAMTREERFKREDSFEHDCAALQALLEKESADEATREMAAQKLTELITEHQNELGLEQALQEAGFANAVVIVQNGAVTVMIPQEKLNEQISMQILTLCIAHTEAGAENVRVMALK